jgi:hypothetical protein
MTDNTSFDAQFERELRQLRDMIVFPETPDVAGNVQVTLASKPQPIAHPRRRGLLAHPWLAIAALVLLAAIAALTSSSVRNTVAELLGVPGIRIEFDEKTPIAQPSPAAVTIGLGERTTLDAAIASAEFEVLAPDASMYDKPDDVYLRGLPGGRNLVTLIYLSDNRLPAAAETGVGLLLMQFVAPAEIEIMVKSVMGEGSSRQVYFNGNRGYWIEGTSSLEILNDPSVPKCCTGNPRPSANVLLWQADGVTYRLESALSRAEAIAVAESMTTIATPEP